MVVVIDSSVPRRVARFQPVWRKCMTTTIRLVRTMILIGLYETRTIGYREKQTVCSSRYPVMRYPSPAAASIWRRARAEGAGFAPSTSARVDTRDTQVHAGGVMASLWGQETQAVGGSPAAGAARRPARASPGGPGSRANPNGGVPRM